MRELAAVDRQWLAAQIAARPAGHSLPRSFYTDPRMLRADLEGVWRSGWLFAGLRCEIARPGDYFLFEFDGDSVIVVVDDDNRLRGWFNTCRHRGSRICVEPRGHASRFVCPYHHWTYARDGSLVACSAMGSEFAKDKYGLHPANVCEVGGLVFVSLSDAPADFEPAREALQPQLGPHELARAKIAHRIEYRVRANWKLVFENNRECYHCTAHHPEYCRATFDTQRDSPRLAAELAQRTADCQTRWAAMGFDASDVSASSDMSGNWFRASRAPLRDGFVTESLDGRSVAPLMGRLTDYDVGTARITTFPNFWCHASSDHAVVTQLTPIAPDETKIVVYWLVHRGAVAGVDYQLDRLLPFWQRTSEQDWKICENNQSGVNSSRYQPGPYAPEAEANVKRFIAWYVERLQALIA